MGKQRVVKTPGGRLVYHLLRKKGSGAKCRECRCVLNAIAHSGTTCKWKHLPKKKRTVARAYGGNLCHRCVRHKIIRAFLIEEQKIVKKFLQENKGNEGDSKPKKTKKSK